MCRGSLEEDITVGERAGEIKQGLAFGQLVW